MLQFRTAGFAGTSLKYSPFHDSRLLVGSAANFGLVGNGRVWVVDIAPDASMNSSAIFDTQDSIFSVAWSEIHDAQFVTAGGDGCVRLFDTIAGQLLVWHGHKREVFDVSWNLVEKSHLASCSWDGTTRLWTPTSSEPIAVLDSAGAIAYGVSWDPRSPYILATANSDSSIRIWDVRAPQQPQLRIASGTGDCLCVDWNKYDSGTIAAAGADRVIRIWDLRQAQAPTMDLQGHSLAVRSVKWSPHSPIHLLTASYDMSVRAWTTGQGPAIRSLGTRGLLNENTRHTEFVSAADWSLWGEPGWTASVGWDQMCYVWKAI